ncbi:MAG: hypothetical protein C4K58_06295 [Flavobacteriaceae bacterium]|nr:MAG: hypothetical protein C4K58_06295 [Flavobacteriaceae bacterium]
MGTQILTRTLKFENLGLILVLKADALYSFSNFRAQEMAYATLLELSHLADGPKERIPMILQSYTPEHRLLQNFSVFDFATHSKEMLYQRKQYHYPPFSRIIQVNFYHKNQQKVQKVAHLFADLLRPSFTLETLLGPEAASIPKINNIYIFQLLIKIMPEMSPKKVKDLLGSSAEKIASISSLSTVKIKIDVDPL